MGNCQFCGKEFHAGLRMHEKFCHSKPKEEKKEIEKEIKKEPVTIEKDKTDNTNDKTVEEKAEVSEPSSASTTEKSWGIEIVVAVISVILVLVWIFHFFLYPDEEK